MSKLYKANHFKPLSQLKLLGEFAKIWFGKNFPVAVIIRPKCDDNHHCNGVYFVSNEPRYEKCIYAICEHLRSASLLIAA